MRGYARFAASPTVSPAAQTTRTSAESVRADSRLKMENAFVLRMGRKSTPMENVSPAMWPAASPARRASQKVVLCVETS